MTDAAQSHEGTWEPQGETTPLYSASQHDLSAAFDRAMDRAPTFLPLAQRAALFAEFMHELRERLRVPLHPREG